MSMDLEANLLLCVRQRKIVNNLNGVWFEMKSELNESIREKPSKTRRSGGAGM